MRVPAGPTDWSWRTRPRRPRGKSAVDFDVVDAMGGHPVDARSRVDIRADDVPDGINAADHAAGLSSSLDNLAASVDAERRPPRSTVLVATATIRVVATEGQIYGRQLQQAGDYTGPHRDPLRYTGHSRPPARGGRAVRGSAYESPHRRVAVGGYVWCGRARSSQSLRNAATSSGRSCMSACPASSTIASVECG